MKTKIKYFALLIVILFGLVYWSNAPVSAEKYLAESTPTQDILIYLEEHLKEQNIPINYIKITQDSPTEIEIGIQSISSDNKFAPDDFMNMHLVVREVVLSHELGYKINALTRVVLNQNGETIDWGWMKIEPENMYTRIKPVQSENFATENLMRDSLIPYELNNTRINVITVNGFQMLDMDFSVTSVNEANKSIPSLIKSLPALVADINSQEPDLVMVKFKVFDEGDNILLSYMYDSQFMTAGWWASDGILVDNWSPSAPPLEEGN